MTIVDYGLVSIMMPAYNCENFIGLSMESVLNQTYAHWELIVVDDCSTDDTLQIVKAYAKKDSRILWLQNEKNEGAALSRNRAVRAAKGRYLAFIDSDDLWRSNKLERQLSLMEAEHWLFSASSYDKIDETGESLEQIVAVRKLSDYNALLKACPGNSTVIYKSDILGKFYVPNIKKRNDYAMWLKVIKKSKYLYGIDEVLSSHRVRAGSLSNKKAELIKYHWIVYRDFEKLSVVKSVGLLAYWVMVKLLKSYDEANGKKI